MLTKKHKLFLIGAGFLNGLFGAGGGMIIVPILRSCGLDEKKAHALCVAVILPLCLLSACIYLFMDQVTAKDPLPYLPWTLGGSIIGSILLPKCKAKFLKILFAALIIFAAGRMLFS
jgi:uncharacterized membrane protein YfcA